MEGNVVNNLCSLPATDLNFTSELNRATAYQIKQAIEKMKPKICNKNKIHMLMIRIKSSVCWTFFSVFFWEIVKNVYI